MVELKLITLGGLSKEIQYLKSGSMMSYILMDLHLIRPKRILFEK